MFKDGLADISEKNALLIANLVQYVYYVIFAPHTPPSRQFDIIYYG